MSLRELILNDFKTAFKAKKMFEKGVLALLQSDIKNQEIEVGKREEGLSDEEIVQLVQRAIKQRKDSMAQYAEGGREESVQEQKDEIAILEKYLPEQLSDEAIEAEVKKAIENTGAQSKDDFGKVMGVAMAALKGQTDGDKVREIVQKILG